MAIILEPTDDRRDDVDATVPIAAWPGAITGECAPLDDAPAGACERTDCPTPRDCPPRGCDLYRPAGSEDPIEQRRRCDRSPGPRRYLAAVGGRVDGRVWSRTLAGLDGPAAGRA